jgi:hypothetical protein
MLGFTQAGGQGMLLVVFELRDSGNVNLRHSR